jgi:hypothetical protein
MKRYVAKAQNEYRIGPSGLRRMTEWIVFDRKTNKVVGNYGTGGAASRDAARRNAAYRNEKDGEA